MASPADNPSSSSPRLRRFLPRLQFSTRSLLIVVTAVALLLGLWSWIAWSLAIAVMLLLRVGGVVVLVFLIQGALQGQGRARHFSQGAAVGMGLAQIHWGPGNGWDGVLWWLLMAFAYSLAGGWAGLRARAWWETL